jgi:hypothetical protein
VSRSGGWAETSLGRNTRFLNTRFQNEETTMVSKLLPVGLMVCGMGFSMQTANAQQWGAWNSGCQSAAPSGPEPTDWHGPSSYQPGPEQGRMAPPPAPSQAPAPNQQAPGHGPMTYQQPGQGAMNGQQAPMPQGQTAQSNNQGYQSFSAEPGAQPMNTYAPNTTYSYPTNGGYYGNSYNGGWNYGYPSDYGNTSNSQFDNARFHGVNPNAYP